MDECRTNTYSALSVSVLLFSFQKAEAMNTQLMMTVQMMNILNNVTAVC